CQQRNGYPYIYSF
nr:immunoglobulin light chain junction region [Macaca mulatta]